MTDKIIKDINELSYEDKKKVYTVVFGLGSYNSEEIKDKLILISLIAASSAQLKDRGISTKDFLMKLMRPKDETLENYLEILAIIVDDFSYNVTKHEIFGAKDSKEIMETIKNLLLTWTPF